MTDRCALLRGEWRCVGFPEPTIGSVSVLLRPFHHAFWGRRGIGMMADGGHHGEGEHDERDVAMPAMPGTGLIVVEAEFVFCGLETILDRPAMPLHIHIR